MRSRRRSRRHGRRSPDMTIPELTPDFFSAVMATVVVRASAIIAAAWLLTRLLRGAAAATRHIVWTAALASLILLPVVSLVLPRWEIPRATAPVASAPVTPMRIADAADPSAQIARMAPAGHAEPAVMPVPVLDRHGRPPVPALVIIALWIVGAVFGVGRLSAGWAAARRLVGRAIPMDGDAERIAGALALQLGVTRPVRVRVSDILTVPVNCGLLRPIILLPVAAHEWTAERLRVVLL